YSDCYIFFFFVFFLLLCPHPRSTLFPYTTLFRSLQAHPERRYASSYFVLEELNSNIKGRRPSLSLPRTLEFTTSSLPLLLTDSIDRKSTRLNSSHVSISYAVFCLKKKKKKKINSK